MSATRLTALAGWLGAAVIAIASILAALAYRGSDGETYSPLDHSVSELGELGVSGLAVVFDVALVIAGACLVVFMLGLAGHVEGWYRYAIGGFGLIAGVAGALVGVFPTNASGTHTMVAVVFFDTAWIAVGLFTLYIVVHRPARFPRWLVVPGGATVLAFVAFVLDIRAEIAAGGGALEAPSARPAAWATPTLEWLTLIGIVAWVSLVATRLWVVERARDERRSAAVGEAR